MIMVGRREVIQRIMIIDTVPCLVSKSSNFVIDSATSSFLTLFSLYNIKFNCVIKIIILLPLIG